MRRTALVVTLHGMHYTGYVFNDYARMLAILEWIATRIPADRVLVFLASWDGRYYWDYPAYVPAPRMGGEAGLRTLVSRARALGFRMMPMFGANSANRNQPAFARVAGAFTTKVDGDRLDLNWVDWDNDRHQDGWLSYMNLGVDAWRQWLHDRIADVIERYDVDAYFLDIAGGWINNPKADMHEGMRRLVGDLRRRFPRVPASARCTTTRCSSSSRCITRSARRWSPTSCSGTRVLPASEPSRAGPRQHRRARGGLRPLESADAVAQRRRHSDAEHRRRHVREVSRRDGRGHPARENARVDLIQPRRNSTSQPNAAERAWNVLAPGATVNGDPSQPWPLGWRLTANTTEATEPTELTGYKRSNGETEVHAEVRPTGWLRPAVCWTKNPA